MKLLKLLALTTTTTLLAACGSDSDDDYAYVRVLHASPDAPAVDVLVDGKAVLTNVQFQQGSGYLRVDEGARTLALRVSGTTGDPVLSGKFNLGKDNYYSVIAQNDVEELELAVLNDTERRNNGSNDVTVVHASPDAPTVDIYVTAADAESLGDVTVPGVSFGANATLEEIATGDYRVRITPTAATQPVSIAAAGPEVVYDSGTLTVNADVTAVAVNSTKGLSPVSLLIWNESNTPVIPVLDNSAEVRIVHAVDSVPVDVFAGGAELLSDFTFLGTTGHVKVAAGELDVAIAPANSGLEGALENLSGTLELERGESYTVIAAGDLPNVTEAQLIVLTDKRESSLTDSGEVRLVHASSAVAADPVDIYVYAQGDTQPAQPNFSDVVLGQDTDYVTLPNGTYTVVIAADGTRTSALSTDTSAIPVAGGSLQTAIAVGNGSGLSAILLNDCRSCAAR